MADELPPNGPDRESFTLSGAEMTRLKAEVEARSREATEAQDRYLRTLAEFDNYRKRMARERDDWTRQAQGDALREVLTVVDNFDRALAAEPAPGADGGFRTGIELIQRNFLQALERLGVRPFGTVGEPFDPQRHEAVARTERPDVEAPVVVGEVQRGYLFRDRILRPAQVVVAVPGPAADPDEADPDETDRAGASA
jgi:molecular chaperone GrpE